MRGSSLMRPPSTSRAPGWLAPVRSLARLCGPNLDAALASCCSYARDRRDVKSRRAFSWAPPHRRVVPAHARGAGSRARQIAVVDDRRLGIATEPVGETSAPAPGVL